MEPIKGSNKGSQLRHLRAMRLVRYRAVCRAMPAHKNTLQQLGRKKLAWGWVNITNRQQLSRIVWPWHTKPIDPKSNPAARVKRGRASNPTAL
jgi:hypothetical protein